MRDLSVSLRSDEGLVQAVRNIGWDIYDGEVLAIVGESGSGKSVSVNTLLGLMRQDVAIVNSGHAEFGGRDLLNLGERELREVRGKDISVIFQDPMASFNPVKTIGDQISEAIRVHDERATRRWAWSRSITLLSMVGVPNPELRCKQYPHQYSGGMRQRAMIAMAMANRPRLLIADEPTTALDMTIQAQIIDVLRLVQKETGGAIVLITHDLGLVAELADRVLVMYAGKIVESAGVVELFASPRHPYTRALLESLPRIGDQSDELRSISGQMPSLVELPEGCAFHPRCSLSHDRQLCRELEPPLQETNSGSERLSACHFSRELDELDIFDR
ncbi:ABC transporter ATP-binding protein [Actinobacteria bacterium YIM 96077]|uniref:ABC transporter ATP-binding protein n=1 Tax=Phytoactinopolyspora halophila TaxID=1981511 RepID=A0A329QI58_9ACTN|nr:ABC transporter ATP-binding protein [Actinobacteria bacterium YIM 96077]RAW12055.1 ABC transporter ATP-binding protein [Phytoactinopolyspora halophila]